MKYPKTSNQFNEYRYVKKFSQSEIRLENFEGSQPRVALIFPDNYEVAGASLAWSWIQRLLFLNGLVSERYFYEEWFQTFYSVENQVPLEQTKVWLFSLQFENNVLNILDTLRKFKIPLKALERNNFHPIIVIGGPVTLFNYKLVDEVADFVFIGDFECSAEQFSQALLNDSKEKIERELLEIEQIYSKKYKKLTFRNSSCYNQIPTSHFITPYSHFSNKLLIEIGRGCIRRCAFCVTGYTKKPVHFAKLSDIESVIKRYRNYELGIISATITDYPFLEEFLEIIKANKIKCSFSSMRADKMNTKVFEILKLSGNKSFTIAPEGISQRLRDHLLKDLNETQLEKTLEIGRNSGFDGVKMYFIITGKESEEDFREFQDFLEFLRSSCYKKITFSFNPLVPKPSTPLSQERFMEKSEYESYVKKIKKLVPKDVKCDFSSYKEAEVQYLLTSMNSEELLMFFCVKDGIIMGGNGKRLELM